MTKYTPGPWEAKKGTGWFVSRPNAEARRECAIAVGMTPATTLVATPDSWFDESECEANARLMAAAPEMLEALRNLMSSMIAAKMAEAGRIGISGTLPELRERFPECFKEIDAAADIIYRVESNGVKP